ncbi:MAG: PIN domain-containing protein [Chloroflexi bacterium]|nr:PIN domain-containing protein [Chloroflexota bacterium]
MLLDTSGLLCLHYQTEPFHAQAVSAYKADRVHFTHSYILAEFIALATARRFPRFEAIAFIADLIGNPDIETLWVDEILHRAAISLLQERPDKAYTLCDAVSFVVMRQHHLSTALTTDKHFAQEGFQRVLVG